ncbi:DUF1679 domain-containing protein [Pseudoscourfieldia marina]
MRTAGGIIGGPHAHEWDATTLSAEAFRLYARLHGAHWGDTTQKFRLSWFQMAADASRVGGPLSGAARREFRDRVGCAPRRLPRCELFQGWRLRRISL